MGSLHVEPLAVVVDLVDLGRVGVDVVGDVENDRTVIPAVVPESVADIEVFVGPVVAQPLMVIKQRSFLNQMIHLKKQNISAINNYTLV